MPLLLVVADNVTKLHASGTECGHNAHFSQRLVNGNPAKYENPMVIIGAPEVYPALWREC